MNWWIGYLSLGLLVFALVVAWDLYARGPVSYYEAASDRLIFMLAAMAMIPVWPMVLVVQVKDIAKHIANPPQRPVQFKFSRRHLVRKVSVQEVAEFERIFDPLGAVPDVPFGFLNGVWLEFQSHLWPTDTLWMISAKEIDGFQLEERQGYAIVRFGRIWRTMITCRQCI